MGDEVLGQVVVVKDSEAKTGIGGSAVGEGANLDRVEGEMGFGDWV